MFAMFAASLQPATEHTNPTDPEYQWWIYECQPDFPVVAKFLEKSSADMVVDLLNNRKLSPVQNALEDFKNRIPKGFNIQIDINPVGYDVTLFDPEGHVHNFPTKHESMSGEIEAAITYARDLWDRVHKTDE